jgi:hypothetical protein
LLSHGVLLVLVIIEMRRNLMAWQATDKPPQDGGSATRASRRITTSAGAAAIAGTVGTVGAVVFTRTCTGSAIGRFEIIAELP